MTGNDSIGHKITPPPNAAASVDARAAAVLVAHQQTNTSGCHCGWGALGHSYCEHVVEELRAAGVLRG